MLYRLVNEQKVIKSMENYEIIILSDWSDSFLLRTMQLSGGRITWTVPLGRRDGVVSSATEASGKLPGPTANLAMLKALFAAVTGATLSFDDQYLVNSLHCRKLSGCRTRVSNVLSHQHPFRWVLHVLNHAY